MGDNLSAIYIDPKKPLPLYTVTVRDNDREKHDFICPLTRC